MPLTLNIEQITTISGWNASREIALEPYKPVENPKVAMSVDRHRREKSATLK